jgi:hypothetical protein
MVSGAVGLLSFDASELLLIASHRCLVTLGEHYLGPDGILFHLPEIEIHLRWLDSQGHWQLPPSYCKHQGRAPNIINCYVFRRSRCNGRGFHHCNCLWVVGECPELLENATADLFLLAGPFELTKLSAQISVLIAERTKSDSSADETLRRSYNNLGTFRTAQNLVRHRGFKGLYSGFHLHMCECSTWFCS